MSPNENSAFFLHSRRQRTETATRSWWLDAQTRAEFQAAALRHRLRMSNSPEARSVSSTFIVGHTGRAK